jgi:hypothetical protein
LGGAGHECKVFNFGIYHAGDRSTEMFEFFHVFFPVNIPELVDDPIVIDDILVDRIRQGGHTGALKINDVFSDRKVIPYSVPIGHVSSPAKIIQEKQHNTSFLLSTQHAYKIFTSFVKLTPQFLLD